MKEILDQLNFYHLLVLDLKAHQRYRDELTMAKFLSRLDTILSNQVRGQILGADIVPLSITLSRVHRVSMGGDSSFSVSSRFENSAILAGCYGRSGGYGLDYGRDSGEEVDTEIRVHVIMLTLLEAIIHLISTETSLVNLSEFRLIPLLLHLLQLLPPPLLLLLCRFFSQTISVSFSYRLLKLFS